MWSKVAKLASPAPRKPAARLDAPLPAEELFLRLRRVLDPDDAAAAAAASSSSARAAEVERLLDAFLQCLRAEEARSETPPLGEVLEHLLENNSLNALVDLVLDSRDAVLRAVLLRWYAEAIDRLGGAWLSHSAVNNPLTKLVRTCMLLGVDSEHELDFVTLLCVVSERIRSTPDLLPVFFRRRRASRERAADPPLSTRIGADFDPPLSPTLSQASTSENSFAFSASQATGSFPSVAAEYDCAVFSALVRYLHREGDLGEAARTGLLALIDVARSYTIWSFSQAAFGGISDERRRSIASSPASGTTPVGERDLVLAFAEWILDSDLADVLGASLGALYGALPSKLVIRPVDDSSATAVIASGAAVPGGMVLGGMGALQEDKDAEITARRRQEEDDALQSQGYGISGTVEFTRALDHFLRLFEFAQEVVERCAAVSSRDGPTVGGSRTPDAATDAPRRQQQLVLAGIASTITTAVRLSFLQSVFYPSLLECSQTDGSAVAVLTYLEAVLEVLHGDGDFAAAVFAFLTGDDSRIEDPPAVARLRANKLRPSPAATSKHNRRRSQGLLLLDRPALRPATATSPTDYYLSSGRFGLRDLLEANIGSSHAATAAAALKLFKTILATHDRWSLTLLDVELDDCATAFPAVPFASLPAASDEIGSSSARVSDGEEEDDDEEEEESVYPVRTPSPPRRRDLPPTPVSALRPLLEIESSSSSIDKEGSADPLDVLLSLVGERTPSYERRRSGEGGGGGRGGGESELVATGFQNYLRDAEAKLARDAGFRRGLASLAADVPESELSSTTTRSPPRSPLLQVRDAPAADKRTASTTHHELATTRTGRRHRLTAASSSSSSVSPVVSSLLAALSAFFSHPPDVNLALTEAIATLALSPYRALDPWCLPNEVVQPAPFSNGQRRSALFVTADHLPTLAQSDSVLAVLQALSGSIAEYRRRIPKFDDYLDDRRKGLFFADNLADALEGIDLASDSHPNGPTPAPPPPPLEPSLLQPAPKASSMTAGLASFFSPRRRPSPAAHSRSPSTPPPSNVFSTPTRPGSTEGSTRQHRPSQLRWSASDESLVAPLSPTPTPTTRAGREESDAGGAGAGSRRLQELVEDDRQRQRSTAAAAGPASPFAAHYRETGSVQVEPILVATPSQVRTGRGTAVKALGGEVDEEDGDDGPEASPSRRLSPLPPPSPSVDVDVDGAPTPAVSDASTRGRGTVSLSTLLDNVIVLEEFVKELAAVVYVRRALGIDPVRRVDTD